MPTVKEAMSTKAVTIRPNASVGEAIDLLLEHHISGAPVVDAEGLPIGIITEFALIEVLANPELREQPISNFMTKTILTVDENQSLDEVAETLRSFRIRRMPVVRNGKVVGIISRRDLLRFVHDTGTHIQELQEDLALSVVIVDDDACIRRLLEKLVRTALGDAKVALFADAESALSWLAKNPCEFLITDFELPDMNGLDLLRRVKERDPWIQVFVVTGHSSVYVAAEALRRGATDYLQKPLEPGDVIQQLRRAVQTYQRWTSIVETAASRV
jgi:CBS domain-containing protein/CheY-like chemotaxis protein